MTALAAGASMTLAVLVAGGGRSRAARRLRVAAPPNSRRLAVSITVAAVVVSALFAGVRLLVLLGAAVAAGLLRQRAARRRRAWRRRAQSADVATLCFAVAAELRAGRTPADALDAAAAELRVLGPAVAAAGQAVRRGADVDTELALLATASGCHRLEPVAAVWAATAGTGARVADVLERLGATFEQDDEGAADLEALLAGPQATVVVLCLLPALGVALGTAMGAAPLRLLLHTPLGWMLTGSAVLLDLCGVAWMRRISRASVAA